LKIFKVQKTSFMNEQVVPSKTKKKKLEPRPKVPFEIKNQITLV
jgi:hypothetical protein